MIEPFFAGIWCGVSKPPCSEYLAPFISEMKMLVSDGLVVNLHRIIVKFGFCICDSPARALIKGKNYIVFLTIFFCICNCKLFCPWTFYTCMHIYKYVWKFSAGTVNFNHKNGCQKCVVTGEFSRDFHHMSFPQLEAPLRTDETFRQREQPSHHKNVSPFEDTDIDMVKRFPISDSLHLLHHGVTKKCLQRWIGKVKGYGRKWSRLTTESVSRYLLEANKRMPSDIHRSLRSLDDLSHWKGVEFRTLLMYVGMVVLRSALENDEYEHFLLLCCACHIVSCKVYKHYIPLARSMFKVYVKNYIHLYGRHSISSNVHNLIHVADDLIENNLESIDELSTYKYENSLRLLTMKLQNCNRPLEQISRRLIEIFHLKTSSLEIGSQQIEIDHDHEFTPLLEYELPSNKNCFSKITIKPDVVLTSRKIGDQWFITHTGDIVKMMYATKVENSFKVCGFSLMSMGLFFKKPIKSNNLSIFKSDGELSETLCMHEISSIAAKMVCLELETSFVYIPLLHTLEILKK